MGTRRTSAEVIIGKRNVIWEALATFTFPRLLLRTILNKNHAGKARWGSRAACLTISFDCDYPRDVEYIPQLLGMLKRYTWKTSFACVGHWIEKFPDEHARIVREGHEVMNHTYSHPDNELLNPGRRFKDIPRDEKKLEISRCHDICKKVLNYEPVGCRIPHFRNLFTPEIYGILSELGYQYSSSTLLTNTASNGLPFCTPEGVYEFPLSTCPLHPFTVFDTWHSLESTRLFYRMGHATERAYCDLFRELLHIGIDTGSYINIYMDPYDIKKLPHFPALLDRIDELHRAQNLWVAPYNEILQGLTRSSEVR